MPTLPSARYTSKGEPKYSSLREAALEYAAKGWPVFPLHNPTPDGCSCRKADCKSVGKHPRIQNGSKGASSDETTVLNWWERWPDANIGIATGPLSGLCVLDVDGDDGETSVAALGSVPATLRALTGRRGADGGRAGYHLYLNHPKGPSLRGSIGTLGKGLDLKAAGGYVVAPPSRHASGLEYEWVDESSPIADAPGWLLAKVTESADRSHPEWGGRLLYEGQRNNVLFRLAAKWRRDGETEPQILSHLRAENAERCRPPLDASELRMIASSVAKYPVGGPDPLQAAHQKASAEDHYRAYDTLLALIRHLHEQRPGLPILLPVARIGALMSCNPTLICRYRKRAIEEGHIRELRKYIPHSKATLYEVVSVPTVDI